MFETEIFFNEIRFNNHKPNPTDFVLAILFKHLCDAYLIVDVYCLLRVCC